MRPRDGKGAMLTAGRLYKARSVRYEKKRHGKTIDRVIISGGRVEALESIGIILRPIGEVINFTHAEEYIHGMYSNGALLHA